MKFDIAKSKEFKEYISLKDRKKLDNIITENKVKCKCGHTIIMSSADRTVCSWCGKWIYRTPEIEFRYNLSKELKKRR